MYHVFALLLFLPTLVHAATYSATPSTFAAMLSRLGPGDTLEIQSGAYPPLSYHQFRFPSGTSWANAPRIVAAPGAQVRTGGIQLRDTQYLHFEGIQVHCGLAQQREGVYLGPGTQHIRVQDAEVSGCRSHGVLVPPESGGHHQFLRLNVHHNGTRAHQEHGMYIAAAHNVIADSQVHHNAGYGIHLWTGRGGADYNVIRGNQIYANGQRGATAFGVVIQDGVGNQVVGNTVRQNLSGDIKVGNRTSGTVLRDNQTGSPDIRQGPTTGTGGSRDGEGPPPEPPPFVLPAPRHLRLLRP